MRVVTASGKKSLVINRTEWEKIGQRNGWLKAAQQSDSWYAVVQPDLQQKTEAIREALTALAVLEPQLHEDPEFKAIISGVSRQGGPAGSDIKIRVNTLIGISRLVDKLHSRVKKPESVAAIDAATKAINALIEKLYSVRNQ